ncbi:PucR family transcriptional regulator, partial [Nonomuraea sp. NPDC004297]
MSTGSSTVEAAVRAERTRLLSGLLRDLRELADVAVTTMRAEIPSYDALGPAFHADVRDQVVKHYRAKLGVLLEDRTVT